MRPSLVVTDLDGTLWSESVTLDPETKDALHTLEGEGIRVLAATARGLMATRFAYNAVGIELPAVLLNGALGFDYAMDCTFHRSVLDAQTALRVLSAFEEAGLSPHVVVDAKDTSDVRTSHTSSAPSFQAFAASYITEVDDLTEVVSTLPILQLCVMGTDRARAELTHLNLAGMPGALSFLMPEPRYNDGGDSTVIVQSSDAGKWSGVVSYCETNGLDPSKVLAIGDGVNDIDLLTNAATACAMSHASSELKTIADEILPSWSSVLELI